MIVVDAEFTGLDPEKDALVSVGAIDLEKPERQFYGECRIWTGAHINHEALLVNGFTEEEVQDPEKQTDGELVAALTEWAVQANDHTFAGQNVYMDLFFLRNAARRNHLDWPFAHRIIDQHSLVHMHMVKRGIQPPTEKGRTSLNSDTIMAYVGIPAEPHPHNALNGAKVAAEAISRVLHDKPLLPEFKEFPIPWLAETKRG